MATAARLPLSRPNIDDVALAAVVDVLRSGALVHGQTGLAFEQALARYIGCGDVVVVSSGTAALHLALLALGIGSGDAVIVPDFTFPATANVVALTGARVILADVDPSSYTVTPATVAHAAEAAMAAGERLRAVMPVHEFGTAADMAGIQEVAQRYGMAVVEDAACALGARVDDRPVGAAAQLACFSFHPRKTLTTGEGGAVSVNDPKLADRLRRLRNHGMERTAAGMSFLEPATNYRLTDFQSALGLAQLPHLDEWIARRRVLALRYLSGLAPLATQGILQLPAQQGGQSWQTFMTVLADGIDRAAVIRALSDRGIEANLGAQCLSEIGIYAGTRPSGLHVAQRLFRQGLALPMFELMADSDVDRVCTALREVMDHVAAG